VIRAGSEQPPLEPLFSPSRVVSAAAEEARLARDEARATLARAGEEAQRIVVESHRQAEQIRASATTQAGEQSAQRIERLLTSLESQLESDQRQRARVLAESSLRIARTILDVEFGVRPTRLADMLSKLLARVGDEPRVTVALHPDDAAMLENHGVHLAARAGYHGTLVIVPDPDLPRATLHLATSGGAYDASLTTQFSRVKEALMAEFEAERHDPSSPHSPHSPHSPPPPTNQPRERGP
jgi:flagellar biosynthesis/type III secretory pathway protein FliH